MTGPLPPLTPGEVITIRAAWDWTQEQAAARAGVRPETWAHWEQGVQPPHRFLWPRLRALLDEGQRRREVAS